MRSSQLLTRTGTIAIPFLFLLLFWGVSAPTAQSTTTTDSGDRRPERGHELEVWTGAGGDPIGTPGVTLGNSVWNVGLRYGWVLTDAHGPGFLRGRFEYAVDVLPVVMVFQPGGPA